MAFTVYILYSPSIDQNYFGNTVNLQNRLYRHTHAGSKATKKAADWVLLYKEIYQDKLAAYRRELEIKRKRAEAIWNN